MMSNYKIQGLHKSYRKWLKSCIYFGINKLKCGICRLPLSSEDLSRNRFGLLGNCGWIFIHVSVHELLSVVVVHCPLPLHSALWSLEERTHHNRYPPSLITFTSHFLYPSHLTPFYTPTPTYILFPYSCRTLFLWTSGLHDSWLVKFIMYELPSSFLPCLSLLPASCFPEPEACQQMFSINHPALQSWFAVAVFSSLLSYTLLLLLRW